MAHPAVAPYVALEKKLRLTTTLLRIWLTAGVAGSALAAVLL
jgi:hypothetical protein